MEKRLILRGFGVGALGGLLAFLFARIMAEPVIQSSINYESGRDAMEDKLRHLAGLAPNPPGPDIFSRAVQRNVGIGTGLILFGAAMGGLVAVAFILANRRTRGRIRPRVLALLIAGTGFLGIYLVPYLKYPANPPAIGHPETIHARGFLYLAMVAISLLSLTAAIIAAQRMSKRFGGWNATLLAGAGFVVLIAVVMAVLPPLGHLHYNLTHYGNYSTETPQPLRNSRGVIVYPGFPADVLFKFRLYSVINQLILWTAVGLGFGALAERVMAGSRAQTDQRREPSGLTARTWPDQAS
jgi:Probable cobalt transporter subunit (CbtA)